MGAVKRADLVLPAQQLLNAVAHGKPTSTSIVDVLGYLAVVDEFFEWFLDHLEPLVST